jgi:hypothetical protein
VKSLSLFSIYSFQVSEADEELADTHRSAAMAAFGDADWSKAVDEFTKAIDANPMSAAFYAKRAACVCLFYYFTYNCCY